MVEVNRDSHYLITHFTPENTPHMSRLQSIVLDLDMYFYVLSK